MRFYTKNIEKENFLPYSSVSIRHNSDSRIITNDTERHVTTGDIMFVPAGLSYTRKCVIDNVITFDFNIIKSKYNEIVVFHPSNPNIYYELFEKALLLWNMKRVNYNSECTSILYHILSSVHEEMYYTEQKLKNIPEVVTNVISIIHKEFSNPDITIKKIADDNYICEVYLRKLFHKYIGVSPKQYLTDVRMNHAILLLESLLYSVYEVALKCGFTDSSYFGTAFKAYTGLSPHNYIRMKKETTVEAYKF